MSDKLTFRNAERRDTALILRFIKELADYEKMLDEVVADEATLEEWLFDKQKAEVIFAVVDGREIGFALFFHNFSTFLGRAGLYFLIPALLYTGTINLFGKRASVPLLLL